MRIKAEYSHLNGKEIIIHLAVEYHGKQHDPRENIGLKAFRVISHYKLGKKDWLNLLRTDAFKIKLFKTYNKDGYYLITVPHTVKRAKRQTFIIDEFCNQTGIPRQMLNTKPIDWKKLY